MLGVGGRRLILRFLLGRLIPPPSRIRNVLDALNSAEVRVVSGPEMLLAGFLKTPYVLRPTGSDLTCFPVLRFIEYWHLRGVGRATLRSRINFFFLKRLYRRAYRKASLIACDDLVPFSRALDQLKISRDRIVPGIPLSIDTFVFHRNRVESSQNQLNARYSPFLVFFPSRMMIKSSPVSRQTGQWKASDVGLRGFCNLCEHS